MVLWGKSVKQMLREIMLKDSPTMLVTKYSKIIADDTYIDILERLKWPAVILNAVL